MRQSPTGRKGALAGRVSKQSVSLHLTAWCSFLLEGWFKAGGRTIAGFGIPALRGGGVFNLVNRDFPDGLRPTTTVGLSGDSTADRAIGKHSFCSMAILPVISGP